MTGLVALHGGGEYAAGDEAAMDALLAAGREAAAGDVIRVVLVPTAAARQRPDLAAAHGRRAFEAAGQRAGVALTVDVAPVLDQSSAADPGVTDIIDVAHILHLPGGDPDLLPAVLRATRAWASIQRRHQGGACLAGASAGAMALAARLWTPGGAVDGLGVVPGLAVLPHFAPARLEAWRRAVDPGRTLAWLGLEEQTLVIGRPGGQWRVAGRGSAHLARAGGAALATASPGDSIILG